MDKQQEENKALLEYMIHHNEHHMEELSELADAIGNPASSFITEALKDLKSGNMKLQEALDLFIKGEA